MDLAQGPFYPPVCDRQVLPGTRPRERTSLNMY
jgi:hypothetical protein